MENRFSRNQKLKACFSQAICSPKWLQFPTPTRNCIPKPRIGFPTGISNPNVLICQTPIHFPPHKNIKSQTPFAVNASSASGYREKVFAIIGVKVYAAGLYVNQSVLNSLNAWKGRSAAEIQEDSSLFNSIFLSPSEKSIQIVLVRDVDGKTFWDALNDAISPRIKSPTPVDESALSTFRSIFQGQPLKKGTFIFFTWPDTSKMLVSISSDGLPSGVDAEIKSENVAFALFDVFVGDTPVSFSLKASVVKGLESILK
ncbi:fatty-acid-binding protein 3, chloroplastic-like isoform X2 [Malus sylvestris]|uniref:fatty-acid-binding protein 3, chloroplastic-like isoform X2 n=1 Tax=Malus sylvestris TaxID=3752 RepID=UPI0021ABEB1E|nr:fatty-acid-binding protein 3, chloroplastic-like isoform X2 [Malus sylvestris]